MDTLQDQIFDKIAEARTSIEIPRVDIHDSAVRFKVTFDLIIDRATYDSLDKIAASVSPRRSVRSRMRRYVKYALATLLPDSRDNTEIQEQ